MKNSTPVSPEKARIRLEEMCVRAEHCESEMRAKLVAWKISQCDSDIILENLKSHKFIDDSRFANSYVREKLKFSHWGRRKIKQGLYVKKISADCITQALNSIDNEEYEAILVNILQSKTKNNPSLLSTYEGRTKLYRFALQRGFESELVAKTIKTLFKLAGA